MSTCWGWRGTFTPESERILHGLLHEGAWAYSHASPQLRANRDFNIRAAETNGDMLMFAPDEFRCDRDVALAAVAQRGSALQHVAGELREDREFLLEAISLSHDAALHVPRALRDDKDFMTDAVQRGVPLKFASSTLQGDLSLRVAEDARSTWGQRRQELITTMKSARDLGDTAMLGKALEDAEELLLPETDLEEPRSVLVALDKYNEISALWELLQVPSGFTTPPVILIKGSWLVEHSKLGVRLPRRQDLPEDAVWDCHELRREMEEYQQRQRPRRPPMIICISYCWLTPTHPDPDGKQLKSLAWFIQHRMAAADITDLAIFIDYCSLLQKGEDGESRSEQEQELFKLSLASMSSWYAHDKTETWRLTSIADAHPPYQSRGWPTFETSVSELLTSERANSNVLDIGQISTTEHAMDWTEIHKCCGWHRGPPTVPEDFERELAGKIFTNGEDADVVKNLYHDTFNAVFSTAQKLIYHNLDWGDAQVSKLAVALKVCSGLRSLDLSRNQIGDKGLVDIMNAISESKTLKRFVISANRIGDAGAEHIANTLPHCKSLGVLDVSFNLIGNAGVQHMIDMFGKHTAHPALQELRLHGNDVGSSAKRSLRANAQGKQGGSFKLSV